MWGTFVLTPMMITFLIDILNLPVILEFVNRMTSDVNDLEAVAIAAVAQHGEGSSFLYPTRSTRGSLHH